MNLFCKLCHQCRVERTSVRCSKLFVVYDYLCSGDENLITKAIRMFHSSDIVALIALFQQMTRFLEFGRLFIWWIECVFNEITIQTHRHFLRVYIFSLLTASKNHKKILSVSFRYFEPLTNWSFTNAIIWNVIWFLHLKLISYIHMRYKIN